MRRAAALLLGACALASCGATTHPQAARTLTVDVSPGHTVTRVPTRSTSAQPAPPAYPELLRNPLTAASSSPVPAMSLGGQPAVSVARPAPGVTVLSFDQKLVTLALHSGTVDAGATGWRYGPAISGPELRTVMAAFNGGFKLNTRSGGFQSFGRTAVPLRGGLASIVTYTDGYTDIGAWDQGVPAPGRQVASVRQNLKLLVNNGTVASNVGCVKCWGDTLGGVADPARAALGITADGRLVWGGGEHLTPAQLAAGMVAGGASRAVELDINPEWVAAYLYSRRSASAPPAPNQAMPGQPGVPGQFLTPYSRDFFTVLAR